MPNLFVLKLNEVKDKVEQAQMILKQANKMAFELPAFSQIRERTKGAIATSIGKNILTIQSSIDMIDNVVDNVDMLRAASSSLQMGLKTHLNDAFEELDIYFKNIGGNLSGSYMTGGTEEANITIFIDTPIIKIVVKGRGGQKYTKDVFADELDYGNKIFDQVEDAVQFCLGKLTF